MTDVETSMPQNNAKRMKRTVENVVVKITLLKKNSKKKVHTVRWERAANGSDADEPLYLDAVTLTDKDGDEDEWIAHLTVNGVAVPLKIDTGTQINVLPYNYFKRLNPKPEAKETRECSITSLSHTSECFKQLLKEKGDPSVPCSFLWRWIDNLFLVSKDVKRWDLLKGFMS